MAIWTTTPWTLPANQAVALNAEIEYALVEFDAGRGTRAGAAGGAPGGSGDEALRHAPSTSSWAMLSGKDLEGLKLKHPFYEREVPVVLGEHVTLEAGTGAVHTAPGHGQEDFALGMQYKLPIDNPVDGSGVYLPNTPLVRRRAHVSRPTITSSRC